jgi:hypothetical protein
MGHPLRVDDDVQSEPTIGCLATNNKGNACFTDGVKLDTEVPDPRKQAIATT